MKIRVQDSRDERSPGSTQTFTTAQNLQLCLLTSNILRPVLVLALIRTPQLETNGIAPFITGRKLRRPIEILATARPRFLASLERPTTIQYTLDWPSIILTTVIGPNATCELFSGKLSVASGNRTGDVSWLLNRVRF
ncbi:hypothetical protein PM082_009109 [Marasmius tenuissimus]|nr:hypothetical protein PM082_009109 [Marasmius tenuissimus]